MTVTNQGFDLDLIRRYDVNGPRYTSYPTANLFTETFPESALREALAAEPPAGGRRPQLARPLLRPAPRDEWRSLVATAASKS